MPLDEGVELDSEMRLGRQAAGDAEGESDFFSTVAGAARSRKSDVIDFGVGAPIGAAGDGDFEFAREIVELGIAAQLLINGKRQGS